MFIHVQPQMEFNALRSQLQFACPDLRNLTNAELDESKWLTKKKVFMNLFSCSRLLEEDNNDLLDLNDERNAESSFIKREGTSREVRLESETVYRTKFMRIVLSALSRLKWPPSMEAFSDPLDSLFNDASVFRDSVHFLLKVAVQSNSHSTQDLSEISSTLPPSSRSGGRRQIESSDNISPFDTSASTIVQEVSRVDISQRKHNVSRIELEHVSDSLISSFGYERSTFTPMTSSVMGESKVDPISHFKERKQVLNWKAFELLQRQNEVLSVRLRELQLSVLKRDEAEGKMSGLISELKTTIAEIAEAGNANSFKKASSRVGGAEGSVLRGGGKDLGAQMAKAAGDPSQLFKEQEMEAFRIEVEREKEEQLSLKEKALGITQIASTKTGKPPTSTAKSSKSASLTAGSPLLCSKCSGIVGHSDVGSSASSVLWSKLHSRLSSLEEQWGAAQRTARSLGEGHGDHSSSARHSPKAGSPPPRFGRSGSAPSPGVLYSAQSTPSRSLVSRTFGVQPALMSSTSAEGFPNSAAGNGGFGEIYNSPPLPPSSRQSTRSRVDGAPEQLQGGLDLSRVHLLQRDLVDFAERAFAWTSGALFIAPSLPPTKDAARRVSGPFSEGGTQHPNALPLSDMAAHRQQEAQDLQVTSWELLLHLSAVAPIAPLALNSPLKSSMTGLEALVHETAELAYPKISKQAQIRLQIAADRALGEQVATIRCWRQARSCLSQWTAHATRVAPTLKMLGRRHKSNVEHAAEDLSVLSSGFTQIFEALRAADSVRIRPTGDGASVLSGESGSYSQRSGVPISPMDSLARGSAGKEVSALVNALRAHKSELADAAETVRVLGAKLAAELKRDLEVVGSTENNLLFAADLSDNVLQTEIPDSLAMGTDTLEGEGRPVGGPRKAGGSRPKRGEAEGSSGKSATLATRPAFDLSLS